MGEIKLPRHVVSRIDRRWAARFGRMLGAWQRPGPLYTGDDPLRSLQVRRSLEGSLRPPTIERTLTVEPR